MLWNWNIIDSCFIASSWRITSKGMFAGSCIGVVLLVMSLEFMRRAVKEYDRYLVNNHVAAHSDAGSASSTSIPTFKPNVLQQVIRAFLHMVQFTVAYFIMLYAPSPRSARATEDFLHTNAPGKGWPCTITAISSYASLWAPS